MNTLVDLIVKSLNHFGSELSFNEDSFVDEENGIDLSRFSYVDTMVTVVDSFNFFNDFGSADQLVDRQLTDIEDDFRTIVNLLTDQIEFADVVIDRRTGSDGTVTVDFKTIEKKTSKITEKQENERFS